MASTSIESQPNMYIVKISVRLAKFILENRKSVHEASLEKIFLTQRHRVVDTSIFSVAPKDNDYVKAQISESEKNLIEELRDELDFNIPKSHIYYNLSDFYLKKLTFDMKIDDSHYLMNVSY